MDVIFERAGDSVLASGKNWSYEQVGDLSKFTQSGKVSSLRQVKILLKTLKRLYEEVGSL